MFDWVLNTSLVLIIKCHIYNAHLQKKWTLRKRGPLTYRKNKPYANIPCTGQKHLNDKLEIADFKYGNNFSLKLQPKIT